VQSQQQRGVITFTSAMLWSAIGRGSVASTGTSGSGPVAVEPDGGDFASWSWAIILALAAHASAGGTMAPAGTRRRGPARNLSGSYSGCCRCCASLDVLWAVGLILAVLTVLRHSLVL